ncbi:MAG: septum formation initiator family protein [Vicinamibacterales bacterium]
MPLRKPFASDARAPEPLRLSPRRRERRWLRPVLVLIAMIVLADALIGEQSLSSGVRARRAYESLGSEVQALQGQNERLRDEARRLREDPGTIEYVARKDLGLAGAGEILVVLK